MKNTITYVPDLPAFFAECSAKYPELITIDENGTTFTPLHVRRVKNANGSLAICKLTDEQLTAIADMASIEDLGWYPEALSNPAYSLVYPYAIPVEYVDENGDTQTYMMPEMIGVFAE